MKKQKRNIKIDKIPMENSATTLISLIVTIIILLILVGICISLSMGKNGIIAKASKAVEEFKIIKIKEKIEIALLDLDTEKVAKGLTLTIEEALDRLKENQILEQINQEEKTGISEGYIIPFTYNENGKVVIGEIEKDGKIRIYYQLNPVGYTNHIIEITIKIANATVKQIKVPDTMKLKEGNTYMVNTNGSYQVEVLLETGELLEKEIVINTIDNLPPQSFTIKAENIEEGFIIKGETQDEQANQENASSGIKQYEYYVKKSDESTYTKYETNQIEKLTQGKYNAYMIAYDKAGNLRKSNEIIVTVKEIIKAKKIVANSDRYAIIDTQGRLRKENGLVENDLRFEQIANYNKAIMLINKEGELYVYGRESNGNLGFRNKDKIYDKVTKLSDSKLPAFQKVSINYNHGIGLDVEGNIWTWGENTSGQLGIGKEDNYSSNPKYYEPQKLELSTTFQDIGTGNRTSYAIDKEGNIWNWGNAILNGTNYNTYRLVPTKLEMGTKFKEISSGTYSNYAIDINDNLWSWGENDYGQLGIGIKTTQTQFEAKAVPFCKKVKKVKAGFESVSIIDEEGNIWTCGRNKDGYLGDGTTQDALSFILIEGEAQFVEVAQYTQFIWAIDTQGNIWGTNKGQKGFKKIEEIR